MSAGEYEIRITDSAVNTFVRFIMQPNVANFILLYCQPPPTATPNWKLTADAIYDRLTATKTPAPTITHTPHRVSVDNAVNIRSGPGTQYGIVGVAQPGETFEVIGYQAGSPYNWLKVRYDGGVAWIAESLTRLHR